MSSNQLIEIGINILINLISSFFFIFILLSCLRPRIKIVPFIAEQNSPFDSTNQTCYGFKIINSSFFPAYDIEAEASLYEIRQGQNGIIDKIYKPIPLKTYKISHLPRRRLLDKKYGDHCVQFFTYEDVKNEMCIGGTIDFKITAKHGLTGLSNIVSFCYTNPNEIKQGKFKSGNYQEII
ncbi:hypothetical protein [Chryseobacterium indologenes]|uniref:hypothetical protein n=1 Tax=Chryseobacterium indologenes TaxID=253 RepID=UPI0009A17A96|nr:hypothetical protein [Chryseobacterium indologenes]